MVILQQISAPSSTHYQSLDLKSYSRFLILIVCSSVYPARSSRATFSLLQLHLHRLLYHGDFHCRITAATFLKNYFVEQYSDFFGLNLASSSSYTYSTAAKRLSYFEIASSFLYVRISVALHHQSRSFWSLKSGINLASAQMAEISSCCFEFVIACRVHTMGSNPSPCLTIFYHAWIMVEPWECFESIEDDYEFWLLTGNNFIEASTSNTSKRRQMRWVLTFKREKSTQAFYFKAIFHRNSQVLQSAREKCD